MSDRPKARPEVPLPVPTAEDRQAGEKFAVLVALMRTLRGPDGCPWDREQDFRSLRRYTLEEAYEVVETIDDGDMERLHGELGDLLLQVVFLSQLGDEEGAFDIGAVVGSITDKLERRHPHVFGDVEARDADAVVRNWEAIKREERGGAGRSLLDDVPRSLPALERAQKLGKRAAQLPFDWPDIEGVLAKACEEIDELRVAIERADPRATEEELGDLLLAATSLARHLGLGAEIALNRAAAKFERRFRALESAVRAGRVEAAPPQLEAYWQQLKRGGSSADKGGDSDPDEIEDD